MKKIRMIVSAAVVFAIVGGTLAFRSATTRAFECQQVGGGSFQCVLLDSNVDPTGTDHSINGPGIITVNNDISGTDCSTGNPCNQTGVQYGIEQ